MLTVKRMKQADRAYVMPRVKSFYQSDAVTHAVPEKILQRSFEQAVSDNPLIEGCMLYQDDKHAGYAYLTHMYATEAGSCVMIEELFIEPELRGQGLGHAFFDWLFSAYPDAARFRLEVTPENSRAAALYKRMGFEPLTYCQMIRE